MDRDWEERSRSIRESVEWHHRNWPLFVMLPVLFVIFSVCAMLLFKYWWQKSRNRRLREQGLLASSLPQLPPYANSAVYSPPLSVRPPPTTVVALPSQHLQPTPGTNSVNPPTPGWNLSETGMVSAQLPTSRSPDSISAISSSPRLLHQPPTAPVLPPTLPSAPAIENHGVPAGFSSNPSGAHDKPPVYADVMKGNSVPESDKYPKAKVTNPDTPPPEYQHTGTVFYSKADAK